MRDESTVRKLMGMTVIISLMSLTGCVSLSQKPPFWTVELSSLDYVQFLSSPQATVQDDNPLIVRLELTGNGYLAYIAGRSERVSDSFWQESTNPLWDDIGNDQLVLSGPRTSDYMQRLVDMGFFGPDFAEVEGDDDPNNALVVFASLNGRKQARVSTDPALRKLFEELLKEF